MELTRYPANERNLRNLPSLRDLVPVGQSALELFCLQLFLTAVYDSKAIEV